MRSESDSVKIRTLYTPSAVDGRRCIQVSSVC